MDKISIVIPAYNATDFLAETLKSALRQNYANYQIVIVDDGSTDKTRTMALKYKKQNPGKIKYIYQENKGLAGARNTGIRNSKSKYLLFLDADDLIEENHLTSLYNKSQEFKDGKKIAFSDTKLLLKKKVIDKTYHQVAGYREGQQTKDLLKANDMPGVHSILFPRRAFAKSGLFDQTLVGAEDHDMYIRISLNGYRFYSTGKPTAIYRIRAGSMSFGRQQERRVVKARLQIANKYLKRKKVPKEVKKEFLRKKQLSYVDMARWHIRVKNYQKTEKWFKKAGKIELPLPLRKKIFIFLAKIAPWLIHLYWQIKDGLFPPQMQQVIDKHIGKEVYEKRT